MARMIPKVLYSNVSSPGEIELFHKLESAPGTDDWVVLHSLDIARHSTQVRGEADFVIVIPGKGVLVVEVKAHKRVKFENGIWHLGMDPPSDKGPFKQVSGNMHSLMKGMRAFPSLRSVTIGKCVVFTDVEFNQSSPEWHDWEVIDQKKLSLRPVSTLFAAVIDHWRELYRHDHAEPTAEQIKVIENHLRPNFEVFISPRAQRQKLDDEVKRYTEEQYGAIDSMSRNKRVLFEGPAGTGKTMLAIEAARRAQAQGRKILFLCFNRLLGSWLQSETESLEFVKTSTLHGYLREIAGVEAIPNEADSSFWEDLAAKAFEKLVEGNLEPFDELVIDEAQDILLRPGYLDILDLVVKDGLAGGRWRIFGDFEKQAIYNHSDSISLDEVVETRLPGAFVYCLRNNCRNSPRVAALVHQLGGLSPGYSKILRPDDGNNPKQLYYKSQDEQVTKLETELTAIEQSGFKRNEIVVLSPKKSSDCAASKLSREWKERLNPFSTASSNQIRYTTIHSFKGLEAPCVIVTDLEDITNDLFYIAITRTLHRLVLLISERAKPTVTQLLLSNIPRSN